MGCWNATCMLSQLPILEGDRVVVVPLHQNVWQERRNSGANGYLDSHALWQPALLPFRGVYNDCGFVEEIEYCEDKKVNQKIQQSIFDSLISKVQITSRGRLIGNIGKDERLDLPSPSPIEKKYWPELELKDILDLQSEIFYLHNFKHLGDENKDFPIVLGFCIMHEELYDEATKHKFNSSDYLKLLGIPIDRPEQKSRFKGPLWDVLLSEDAAQYLDKHDWHHRMMHFSIGMISQSGYVGTVKVLCEDAIIKYPPFMVPLIFELFAFEDYCMYTRKMIMPQPGAGRQDRNVGNYIGLMEKTLEFCKKRVKKDRKHE